MLLLRQTKTSIWCLKITRRSRVHQDGPQALRELEHLAAETRKGADTWWDVGLTQADPYNWSLFSAFCLGLLSSFAYFNPLELEKLFNKLPASLELVDVGQLDTLIRHWFKHRWGLTLFTNLGGSSFSKFTSKGLEKRHDRSQSQAPPHTNRAFGFTFYFQSSCFFFASPCNKNETFNLIMQLLTENQW